MTSLRSLLDLKSKNKTRFLLSVFFLSLINFTEREETLTLANTFKTLLLSKNGIQFSPLPPG